MKKENISKKEKLNKFRIGKRKKEKKEMTLTTSESSSQKRWEKA